LLADLPSPFPSDFNYLHSALDFLRHDRSLDFESDDQRRRLSLKINDAVDNLEHRLHKLPDEVQPDHGERLILTADPDAMQDSIDQSLTEDESWPNAQYLWRQSPVVQWANDRMAGNFGRHTAPVIQFPQSDTSDADTSPANGLHPDETTFILSGLIPNQRSQPLIHQWFGVVFRNDELHKLEAFDQTRRRTQLGQRDLPNRQQPYDADHINQLLPQAVDRAEQRMHDLRDEFEDRINEQLQQELDRLENLRDRQLQHQQQRLDNNQISTDDFDRKRREIKRIFDEYFDWIESTMTTEDAPFIQVMAVLAPYGE
jgi:ElaB/YqjD/DUF883 family membrane-anchored ribosome-binding protein